MEQTFEATIEKREKWYIGWVDAVHGAFSQGKTVKEVEENLKEAVQLILESQRELGGSRTGIRPQFPGTEKLMIIWPGR